MKIKTFIVTLATVAGLIVSTFTAVMTFVIIGEPIHSEMFIKISLTILSVLPIIAFLSLFSGTYLSRNSIFIQKRLAKIKNQKFTQSSDKFLIEEVNEINKDINYLSNQLETLIGDLKQKNHNLSNLLISMSHDIKTPMTIINGYIEEIEDGLVSKKQLPETLDYMKKEINFLNELTIDMLEFISSMERHKAKEQIILYYFIENEVFPHLPKNENIQLINKIDKDLVIKFNKIDLKKICINIICNAIKHIEKGYVKVSSKDENIYFENNGSKIEKEYSKKIFEPFFTTSKSKNRKNRKYRKNGFGLGLSVVSNLSANNSYKCILKSSDEEKTIFSLEKDEVAIK
ncbi:MAG: HAMP domain-containing histidine kinase [Campylobacteraceae bacterium]|nr:HAMP domain-containing histidine kinase [Campylobacteraceae bacterium]